MKRIKLILILVACLLLITSPGLAMVSTNYQLNWYTPLTGGGGPGVSTNYTTNVTVGQSVVGRSTSSSYKIGLGYWPGLTGEFKVLLPVVNH